MPNNQEERIERMYFEYVVNRIVPASAVNDPVILTILSDADFEWWWTKASRTSALLTMTMTEQATGRAFFSNAINIDNLCGTGAGNAAFPLAVPYIMPATRAYQFNFTDTSAAPNTVQLVLSGFKLFPRA